jgi:5-methylcytosine-specific restriction endonuclease McrA
MVTLEQRKVLVLNKSWSPVNIVPLKEAIGMLFPENGETPRARIIDAANDFMTFTWDDWSKIRPNEGEDVIRGIGRDFRIPEVILLTVYDKTAKRKVRFSRRAIYKRDNYQCMYCGGMPGTEELTIDHVLPRCLGGQTTWLNCVVACVKCNSRKDAKTIKQAGMKLLKEPTKPKFDLFAVERKVVPKSWTNFLSESYWSVELQNDM